jgi:hypothetical protein
MAVLNWICWKYTAFKKFDDLVNADGNYRPSLDVGVFLLRILADGYDRAMEKRGDSRRAYRFD